MNPTRLRGVVGAGLACVLAGVATVVASADAQTPNSVQDKVSRTVDHCVIAPDDARTTVDSLRTACSGDQILALFAKASLGKPPVGQVAITLLPVFERNGVQVSHDAAKLLSTNQNRFGKSLTFASRPGGITWVHKDYIFGQDAGGRLTLGKSEIDGKPVWQADFRRDFVGIPVSIHEYRQLTSTVWIGRDRGGLDSSPGKVTGGAFALD